MDAELHNLLAEVETLVPISVIVSYLETRLLHNGHHLLVAAEHIGYVLTLPLALDVIVTPLLHLGLVGHLRIGELEALLNVVDLVCVIFLLPERPCRGL